MDQPRPGSRGRLWRSLAVRLFTAQVMVVLAGGATMLVVAAAVGPAIFRRHLAEAADVDPATARHVEEAYRAANALSLSLALLAALVAALTVSAYLSRRLGRSVGTLAHAAARFAGGDYASRVTSPGLGTDFDMLASAYNAMADRLQAVEVTRLRLLADLGHEMRTPLSTIEGYLDAAEDGVSVADEDTLAVLRAQTGRLRRLAEDISAVSRAEERLDLHRTAVAPADLVRTALAAARSRYAAKSVALDERVDAGLPHVFADPLRMAQVLGNLLDNALRHTPAGGRVVVSASAALAETAPAGGATGPASRRVRGWVRISVTDNGAGIAAEHLPHVFERFYRAEPARERSLGGSGIGLAIAQAIVTAHGGRVGAQSPGPGRGTTVWVTLPVAR